MELEGPKGDYGSSSSEEKRLELRLGPPGDQDWANRVTSREREAPIHSLGCRSGMKPIENGWIDGGTQTQGQSQNHNQNQKYFFQRLPRRGQDLSHPCSTGTADEAYSPSSANPAVPNSSHKRSAAAPVVGWPPVRSFRRNLATAASSKSIPEAENVVPNKITTEKAVETLTIQKGLLVKINMDGVPIGRKVDLRIYDSYEKLSSAVDELFGGLLAAQGDSSAIDIQKRPEDGERKIIRGRADGTGGEYNLVYEDNEGDRMLVGDVPWHMFVSTVKRLRVLKTSDLSSFRSVGIKQDKVSPDAAST